MSRKTKSDRFSPYFDSRSGKCHDAQQLQDEQDSQTSKLGSKSPRKRARKYGDMTEDEVMKLLLPDRVDQNLDILFIGINPGLTSAYKGHHYAGPNKQNHFIFRKEIKDGVEDLISKIKRLKPLVACFNGKGIYEIFSRSKCEIGNQPECIPGTDVPVYVMPSTSGRTMTYPRASDKLRFFQELKELRDARKAMTANTVAEDNT
ncbi:G/T mismatch-specific thymine DNA glycosylase [Exaiptasia diaphana]|uniref:G/T mismatch-specific thymine DNA glycosylase n=1 Tax=Exaiptasia diaphana TaxID=2652724 RepID=A0A913YX14_EXADI|nr:G/T mismatch-specific thymine DNA glycosylase [Exaiptasia diaphana]